MVYPHGHTQMSAHTHDTTTTDHFLSKLEGSGLRVWVLGQANNLGAGGVGSGCRWSGSGSAALAMGHGPLIPTIQPTYPAKPCLLLPTYLPTFLPNLPSYLTYLPNSTVNASLLSPPTYLPTTHTTRLTACQPAGQRFEDAEP